MSGYSFIGSTYDVARRSFISGKRLGIIRATARMVRIGKYFYAPIKN